MNDLPQTSTAPFAKSSEGGRRLLVFIKGRHASEPLEIRAKAHRLTRLATTAVLCIAALMIVAVLFACVMGRL